MYDLDQTVRLIATLRETPEAVVMDTEQTCWEGSWERRQAGRPLPHELREVIQIGAVIAETTSFAVLAAFEIIVRPRIAPVLTPFCVALTGVSQARVDAEGRPFPEALDAFLRFVGTRPVIVYNADEDVLRENVAINDDRTTIPSFIRLRPALEACGIDMVGVNSGKIARALGSTRQYREHDALADVRSMADGLAILAGAVDRAAGKTPREIMP